MDYPALMRIQRGACVLAAVGTLIAVSPLAAQSAVERAARDSIAELGLQTQLPAGEPEAGPWNLRIPPEFVWGALLCGLVLLLYSFRDMLPIWRLRPGRGFEASAPDQATPLAAASADTAASAADDLGRQGRFVEAIHMLLLLSLSEMRRHLGERFADSLTSREILRGSRLSAPGRASLREIVTRVEWTYFGGYPATFDDYTACRQSFENLIRALQSEPRA